METPQIRSRRGASIAALILLAIGLLVVALTRSSSTPARRSRLALGTRESVIPTRESISATGGVVSDPIDPRYLTALRFGETSFWIQPWRAYLDTWPASRLVDALGINFNVEPSEAQAVAHLLHDSGFKLARIEIGWGSLSYEDPERFVHEADIRTRLTALHDYGLRPLILLNANSGAPCPAKRVTLETIASAPAGASTVTLSPASAAQVAAGRTGFNAAVFNPHAHRRKVGGAETERERRALRATREAADRALTPEQRRRRHEERRAARRAAARAGFTQVVLSGNPAILITKVGPNDLATLSRPLPAVLAAGAHGGTTLLYAPFSPPKLPDGAPNPAFAATLRGWLSYVATVSREAQSIFGSGGYDLEVWNELGFGSQFLNSAHYYAQAGGGGSEDVTSGKASSENAPGGEGGSQSTPTDEEGPENAPGGEGSSRKVSAGEGGSHAATAKIAKEVIKALLDETVAYVRNPANGIAPGVGITDGFASQTPFTSGAQAPVGLTALSKHPYAGLRIFPAEYHAKRGAAPLDALGRRDTAGPRGSAGSFTPLFVPHYNSLFPEYFLTATSTETLIRDIAPFTTSIYGDPHGREVGPPGGTPPQKWITEYNLGTAKATPVAPDETTPEPVTLTPADKEHFEAKALLRSLVASIDKGIAREYFFAAAPGALSLISEHFYTALQNHPGTYPGDQLGGETMSAFHNLLTQFQGPGPNGTPRQLKLLTIAQNGNHAQFTGDATPTHPSLYDRDVLAVLPFQASPTRFLIPIYVMTRDLLTLYEPNAPTTDIDRYDLPNETFQITLGNLPETTNPPTITAYDPLHNQTTPTQLISRTPTTATIQIAATDYPRILTLNYDGH